MRDWGDRLKQVEKLAQSFQHKPVCSRYKPRLAQPWQPGSVWKLFPRQSAAIAFAKSSKEDVHVFALEKECADVGQRMFLVTSYAELWHYYRTYRQSLMHSYEVIPEGAVCNLYFDLEYHRAPNTGLDGNLMVASLIQYVCERLEDSYGIKCSSKDVLNLDSSTEEKFSRHLIFLLPNAAFKDNSHVGGWRSFIDLLITAYKSILFALAFFKCCVDNRPGPCSTMENIVPRDQGLLGSPQAKRHKRGEDDLSFLLVKNKEGLNQLFVDLGVYTKNRNFRLYKSSKLGKNVAFMVAEDNQYIPKPDKRVSEEERIFLASLISNVSFTGQRILTWDTPEVKKGLRSSAQNRTLTLSVGDNQCSPYSEVDEFVTRLVSKGEVKGTIRRWNYFVSEQLLVYDIVNYRWCENVGRHHRSNNIMILVDLKEEVWYQRCHDPECRRQNFRSSSYPLPEEICISHILKEDEEDQEFLMDEAGNIELSQSHTSDPAAEQKRGKLAGPLLTDDTDVWEDNSDDPSFLEALDEVERSANDIPDALLLLAADEYEEKS
uniref:DNA-directed primase/polymerase protein n=1 Tax=Denticeps clupeoides TaxID=299321 RepID=A0AAY4AQB4_9TELE